MQGSKGKSISHSLKKPNKASLKKQHASSSKKAKAPSDPQKAKNLNFKKKMASATLKVIESQMKERLMKDQKKLELIKIDELPPKKTNQPNKKKKKKKKKQDE